MALPPVWSRISPEDKSRHDRFFALTNPQNINRFSKGANLSELTALAEKAHAVLVQANPIYLEGLTPGTVIQGRQWELDHLSPIKTRLAQAIQMKRNYYESHIIGRIVKCILKLFKKWNNGDTAAITTAEKFLMARDSRLPLKENAQGLYQTTCLFPLIPAMWARGHLDTSNFYNYNPRRMVPLLEHIRYDTLHAQDPMIMIRV